LIQKINPYPRKFFKSFNLIHNPYPQIAQSTSIMANVIQGDQDINKDKSDQAHLDLEIQTKIPKPTENSSFETSGKTSGYSGSNSNSALDMVNLASQNSSNNSSQLITQNLSQKAMIQAQNQAQNQGQNGHQMTQQIPLSSHALPSNLGHPIPIQHISQNNSTESVADMSTDSNNFNDEVRTLFVSGLPMDVKQRELYLLFRTYDGYQGNIIRMTSKAGKPPAPVGFVTFNSRKDADRARVSLQGVKFDPFDQMPLRLEFARSNTKARLRPASPGFGMNGMGVMQGGMNGVMMQNGGMNGMNSVGLNGQVLPTLAHAVPAHTIIGRQIGDYFGAQLVAQAQANANMNGQITAEAQNCDNSPSPQNQSQVPPVTTTTPVFQQVYYTTPGVNIGQTAQNSATPVYHNYGNGINEQYLAVIQAAQNNNSNAQPMIYNQQQQHFQNGYYKNGNFIKQQQQHQHQQQQQQQQQQQAQQQQQIQAQVQQVLAVQQAHQMQTTNMIEQTSPCKGSFEN